MTETQKRWGLAAAAFLVLAVAGVVIVTRLTPPPLPNATDTREVPSLRAAWADAIGNYGIEPVFPPEEDLAVGDVLAVVVADHDTVEEDKKVSRRSPFLKRSVKLAHIDVRRDLEEAYSTLPTFSDQLSDSRSDTDVGADAAAKPSVVARRFTTGVSERNLPRAAFTSLKIQGVNTAGVGLAAGGAATATYGANNEGVEELHLSDVSTYGLPSARALEVLNGYCSAKETKKNCLDATVRSYLYGVVGSRIYDKYVPPGRAGETAYLLSVDIILVNRVYLTRSIEHLRRVGHSQGGRASLSALFGQSKAGRELTVLAKPTEALKLTGDERTDVAALKKRIDLIEQQLMHVQSGGALVTETSSGTEILLKPKLTRPVAFGYRGVRYEPKSD